MLFLIYTIGYPFFCLVLLTRTFAHDRTSGVTGWLWRHFALFRPRGVAPRRVTAWSVHEAPDSTVLRRAKSLRKQGVADQVWNPRAKQKEGTSNDCMNQLDATAAKAQDSQSDSPHVDPSIEWRMGFLVLGYRTDSFAYCLLLFPVHLALASVEVWARAGSLSLLLFCVVLAVETLAVGVSRPHTSGGENAQRLGVNVRTTGGARMGANPG